MQGKFSEHFGNLFLVFLSKNFVKALMPHHILLAGNALTII